MVNERQPWQLTVGELRAALAEAQDEAVVSFALAAEDIAGLTEVAKTGATVLLNVEVRGGTGPVFGLRAAHQPRG